MGYLKIYRLEKFFYDTVKKRIFECLNLWTINELYGRKGAVSIAEVFAKELEEEEAGKRFEYNIRGFIMPNADKYLSVYEQARQRAFIDYLYSRKGQFRTMKETKENWKRNGRKRENDLLTVAQAARIVGCTENAIRYQLQTGNLTRFENAAGKIRISRNEVLDKLLNFEKK